MQKIKGDVLRKNTAVDVVIFIMKVHLLLQGFQAKDITHKEELTIFNYLSNMYIQQYKSTNGFTMFK
jgi:hypothetical protein